MLLRRTCSFKDCAELFNLLLQICSFFHRPALCLLDFVLQALFDPTQSCSLCNQAMMILLQLIEISLHDPVVGSQLTLCIILADGPKVL
jgi:hypothetical protein